MSSEEGSPGEPFEPASGARNLDRLRAGVGVALPQCPVWDESTLLPLRGMGLRLPNEARREESLPGFAHRVWFPQPREGWTQSGG